MKYFPLLVYIFLSAHLSGQSIGIGNANPAPSAILDIKSTTQGMVLSRMTTTQRLAIQNPINGLLVYDTDKQTIYYFDGQQWIPFLFATDPDYLPAKKIYYEAVNSSLHEYGYSADLKGNYAIVGAPGWEPVNNPSTLDNFGKAIIYFRNNGSWSQQSEIFQSINADEDRFGHAVATDGTWAVIGVPNKNVGANANEGAVQIFKRNGTSWTFFQEITGSNATTNDKFGSSVSIDNNIIVVGAPEDDIVISGNTIVDQGSAYVFEYNGSSWVQRAKLFDPVAAVGSNFGFSVDIDASSQGGYYLIAGAPYKDVGANLQQGSAYGYGSANDPTTWTLLEEFTNSSGNDNHNFGYEVGVHDQTFTVAAPNLGTFNDGGAYYFKFQGGTWIEHFMGSGKSVSIENGKVLVGNPLSPNSGNVDDSGFAGIYYADGQNGLHKPIVDVDSQNNSQFGKIVRISGNIALVINTFGHLQFTHWQE